MPRRIAFIVLGLAAFAQAAPPATAPATKAVSSRHDLEEEQASLPQAGTMPVENVVAIQLDNGFLQLKSQRPAINETVSVTFPKWPGFGVVEQRLEGTFFTLRHAALSNNDRIETRTWVSTHPDTLQVNRDTEWQLTADPDGPAITRSVTLMQTRNPAVPGSDVVTLIVQINRDDDAVIPPDANDVPEDLRNAKPTKLNLSAGSFADLCRDQPAAVHDYLLPIFHDLGAANLLRGSDPARAWQVLGPYLPADPALAKQIDALLVRLDGDDFADRAKAEHELIATGAAGAVELRRRDLAKLSPDPRSAVENALRHAEPLPAKRAAELAKDVPFLLETLSLDDARLAATAAKRLADLTGKKIDLPANLSEAERGRRIQAYAASLGSIARPAPTTAPVTPLDEAP